MLVNEKIKEELYENAGDIRVQKARLYAKTGKVEIAKINYTNKDNFEITGKVTGQEIYRTNVTVESGEISDITCECQDYRERYAACKHIIATIMEFDENQKYENMLLKDKSTLDINKKIRANAKYRSFTQIVNELYEEEMHEAEEKKAEEDRYSELEKRCSEFESSFFDLQMENLQLKRELEEYKRNNEG